MTDDLRVIDASALVLAVTDTTDAGLQTRQLIQGHRRHAPHLIDAEVGNALRHMVRRNELSAEGARTARQLAEKTIQRRHPHHGPLSDQAWRLRHNLTFYDALYAALAKSLGCTLITGDLRLARALGSDQPVDVV